MTIRRLNYYSIKNRIPHLSGVAHDKRRFIILAIVCIALITIGIVIFKNRSRTTANANTTNSNKDSIEIAGAKKQQTLNKEFEFPVNNADGNEVGKMQYTIEKAELRDELIVQGKRATSIPGRTFLVLSIKITNNLERRLQINTRDYIRLSVNDNSERLEFTIHNDPVEIGAISTRPTRLAIAIDDVNQKLTLYIGEIKAEKQSIEVVFE